MSARNCKTCRTPINDDDRRWCGPDTRWCRDCRSDEVNAALQAVQVERHQIEQSEGDAA